MCPFSRHVESSLSLPLVNLKSIFHAILRLTDTGLTKLRKFSNSVSSHLKLSRIASTFRLSETQRVVTWDFTAVSRRVFLVSKIQQLWRLTFTVKCERLPSLDFRLLEIVDGRLEYYLKINSFLQSVTRTTIRAIYIYIHIYLSKKRGGKVSRSWVAIRVTFVLNKTASLSGHYKQALFREESSLSSAKLKLVWIQSKILTVDHWVDLRNTKHIVMRLYVCALSLANYTDDTPLCSVCSLLQSVQSRFEEKKWKSYWMNGNKTTLS